MIYLLDFSCVMQLKAKLRLIEGHVSIVAGPESRLLRLKEPLHRRQVNPRSLWL